jgi:hypothetical protein
MRRGGQRCIAVLFLCGAIPGCLLNSVHSITRAPQTKPDAAHAIVVIGIGLDVAWPYTEFQLSLAEYSVKKQSITGNCFHYNRIDAARPSLPAKVTYLAFEVPANVYVFLNNPNAPLAPSSMGHAFIAPPGGTVYFGDYILAGSKSVQFRQDIAAARAGVRALLPRGTVLELAEQTTVEHARGLLCTP